MFSLNIAGRRSEAVEYMDMPVMEGNYLDGSFRFIDFVNRYGGGYRTTIMGLKKMLGSWPKSKPIKILDVGCGAGGMGAAISKWGKARGFDIRYSGIDRNEDAIKSARDKSSCHNVEYKIGNLFDADLPEADFVIVSMVFHHFTDIGIREAIIHLLKKSRHGLIVNDLIRSLASYAVCYLLTLFVKDKVCRNDSLLSVRKGFRAGEMRALLESLKITGYIEKRIWGRLLIAIPKNP